MATLPPRQNLTPTKISRQHLTPLEVLLQMGFPKYRADKALAATGHRGVQLASDWLLAHVNDTSLDLKSPREYVLYLCPTGPLYDQIEVFWSEALQKCGWNAAHNLVPHITLCSFFKCLDENGEILLNVLKDLVQRYLSPNKFPLSLKLDKYVSPNYMGLFLNDLQADSLKNFALQFVQDISGFACASSDALKKELHLTLAYSFSSSHYSTLENLASKINHSSPAGWEVRLYSRDTRIISKEVHKVLYSHVPREPDELELLLGDFVYVNGEALSGSLDGWVEGTSWLTGCQGFLPVNYIERTAESDAWTLHRALPIIGGTTGIDGLETLSLPRRPPISLSLLNLLENSEGSRRSTEIISDPSLERLHSRQASLDKNPTQSSHVTQELEALYAKVELSKKAKYREPLYRFPIDGPRKIIVVRHGERVDFTFGDWIRFCFDNAANYTRKDLNMPERLPRRDGTPHTFYKDCTLTNVGLLQAKLLGEAMLTSKVKVHHVYCSPSLRCIQTCTNLLKGLGIADRMPINIEPGLFEWLAWYHDSMPTWMTIQELQDEGFNINPHYVPLIKPEELKDTQESCEQFYSRNAYLTQSLLSTTQNDGGTLLLVGHAATVDTCVRQLVGGLPRTAHEMTSLIRRIPYCGFSYTVQDSKTGVWSLQEPPFLPVTHSANARYEWKILTQ